MLLEFDILLPDLALELDGEALTVAAMASAIAAEVKSRAARGVGAQGNLPKPKDGGRPLWRTGTLIRSIEALPSARDPTRWAVRATGDRPTEERGATKVAGAKARTKALRAERVGAFIAANPTRALALGKRELRKELKLGKVRVRAADTNAALAGILSVPPRDKRAKAGGRKPARVLEANDDYRQLGARVAAAIIQPRLVAIGPARRRNA